MNLLNAPLTGSDGGQLNPALREKNHSIARTFVQRTRGKVKWIPTHIHMSKSCTCMHAGLNATLAHSVIMKI